MKIAIIGCGAMGSVYAALLADSGNEVWAIDTWEDHISAINRNGLRVEGASGDRTVSINATTDPRSAGECELIIVATKASGVAAAAVAAKSIAGPNSIILTIQNGLGAAERIAESIETKQVMIGVVGGFGASMKGPGHAHHNGMQLVRIGEMNGGVSDRLEKVVQAWVSAGFTAKGYPDIHQMIWEKFICNVTYSAPCALMNATIGQIQENPDSWSVALSCAKEADAVARAKEIELGFDDVESYVRDFGANMPDARPSMLLDHMALRPSEIDGINGAVPIEAAKIGMTAPINALISSLIRGRESNFKQ
ncbi:MAG: 2-dehydropantoate 2-reductase [Rhodospirillaceae bacterium]|jgi:2-dehydropantoate 2-reductase|nr:2-dehydropantoate 2-reductase [Rhodospirillaceae bacterium]MBT6306211.1 2-dehydropantoate 2-reductase [Rhodospirillaceae bacterium]MDC0997776.1 2-dehydropantoate 2-reductase [Alphaproteobacteria bacterium]MDC1441932.1 2-dehydropantoate 2-reductase [Rhodospirillaceae bacterium]